MLFTCVIIAITVTKPTLIPVTTTICVTFFFIFLFFCFCFCFLTCYVKKTLLQTKATAYSFFFLYPSHMVLYAIHTHKQTLGKTENKKNFFFLFSLCKANKMRYKRKLKRTWFSLCIPYMRTLTHTHTHTHIHKQTQIK